MFKTGYKKTAGQATIELAVFGAVLIFLIGTIVRTAVGNSYSQDQNFKAMRMAMLASWNGSLNANSSHNNASVLFVEDRLSPDASKYGDIDRNPSIAQGSGSFSYEMIYPLSGTQDVISNLPIMDIYINGQHFPFTTASYVQDRTIVHTGFNGVPACSPGGPYESFPLSQSQCQQNQCLRNQREWEGGKVKLSMFINPAVAPVITGPGTTQSDRMNQETSYACTIFTKLADSGVISQVNGGTQCSSGEESLVSPDVTLPSSWSSQESPQWTAFVSVYETTSFPGLKPKQYSNYLSAILNILVNIGKPYKLFYTQVPNPGDFVISTTPPDWTLATPPPICNAHPCYYKELSFDTPLVDSNGNPVSDGATGADTCAVSDTNCHGVMQYDLLRNGDYTADATGVWAQFPTTGCPTCMRHYVAWEWSATAGVPGMVGIDGSANKYPQLDVDGRLKTVLLYDIHKNTDGTPKVSYEDFQGGDIDQSWDSNSCGVKPGLQSESQIISFTSPRCADGTCPSSGLCPDGNTCGSSYLIIKEGKLYNPETGLVVRSANKRDSVDLIQRIIQLSNNTGRFCSLYDNSVLPCAGAECKAGQTGTPSTCDAIKNTVSCPNGKCCPAGDGCDGNNICQEQGSTNCPTCSDGTTTCTVTNLDCPASSSVTPNPVEFCADEKPCNCFVGDDSPLRAQGCPVTIKMTCYDIPMKTIFVRSRLQDLRGRFWMTNASGQLGVK